MFTIHVQKIEEEEKRNTPVVLKAKGEIQQYPSWDENDKEWE